MPTYLVKGIYRETGRDFRDHEIEAPTVEQARALAADLGMIVRHIRRKPDPPQPTPEPEPQPPAPVSIPDYPILQLAGLICSGMGGIFLIAGVLTFWSAVFAGSEFGGPMASVMAFLAAITPFVIGLCLGGAGQLMLAVRDIARNSFRAAELRD